ncbi:hypothetical protein HBA92_21385 [Ochrobactrum sp. MR28]|nr:hypothetical protein [Ochrobactrum sp. MR28]MBX8818838.1 hypothetical protein [Ochrobactrum sp. MR31]
MQSFGNTAEVLSSSISAKENDLRLLKQFEAHGGEHRLVVNADHPSDEVRNIISTVSKSPKIGGALIRALIKVIENDLVLAKAELKKHVLSPVVTVGEQV